MKKQVRILSVMLSSILTFTFLMMNSGNVFAEEGAQAPTKGEIILFDESGSGSNTNTTDKEVKPKGRLPSTGELVKYSFLVSGGLLASFVCVLYVRKNRKKQQKNIVKEQ